MMLLLVLLLLVLPVELAAETSPAEARAEADFRLPAGLLHRVALAETGDRARRAPDGRPGGCSVSRYQLHLPTCDRAAVWLLSDRRVAAMAAARVLAWSRARCSGPRPPAACRRCVWALYNSHSRTWCGKVDNNT